VFKSYTYILISKESLKFVTYKHVEWSHAIKIRKEMFAHKHMECIQA